MPRLVAPALALVPKAAGAILWLTAASALAQSSDKYRWELKDTDDGCQIHTSSVAGKDYVAAKSVCVIPVDIEVVAAVLRDIENYPEWMEDCSQTKMLKVVDRQREVYIFWFRQHIALFTDRDIVLRSELVVNEDDRRVISAVLTDELPYDSGKGYIRMASFAAEWVLERVDDGRTRVSYMIDPNLKEGLPVGIANSTIKKIPFKSIRKLTKMAKHQKYLDLAKKETRSKPAGTAKASGP